MLCFLAVAVLEARKLKKMDITGASDPYVKLKLFDQKQKRIGKKKKTSVKSCNLNPYWNESFVFIIEEMEMKRVTLDITVKPRICAKVRIIICIFYQVCDYDLIGGGDPIGKIKLGWSQNKEYKPGFKHWKEALENPRRPIIKWHVLQVSLGHRSTHFIIFFISFLLNNISSDQEINPPVSKRFCNSIVASSRIL